MWDARTILAFFDCLRSIQHSFVPTHSSDDLDSSSSSSGGDGDLTLPPVTAALVTGLLLVFTRPGGVALRDVALSPFCVVDRREYWRCVDTVNAIVGIWGGGVLMRQACTGGSAGGSQPGHVTC